MTKHSEALEVSTDSSGSLETPKGRRITIPKREKWASRTDFYLSCAGGFIGLGNVWRFPYLCYENGGAIFFIPYVIALFLAGIPIFFLEVVVGQYTSEGGITAWRMLAPISAGIGYGSIILTCVLNTYYIVVLGWSLFYFLQSFSSSEHLHQIWNSCDNAWNNPETCRTVRDVMNSQNSSLTNIKQFNSNDKPFMTPIEEYWENYAIKIDDDMTFESLFTDINWNMLYCVVASWVICYFCVWKGIGWTGKVVMFTATFPVFMLFVLLIRGLTLPGAMKGVEFYLIPKAEDWGKLWETKIWIDATTQVLFSYALCKGALTSLGSYNKFKTNCWKDVCILSCCNSGVSVISGFAIFGVLGFMAEQFGVEVENVAKSGPGLAFIAFPQAILEMPYPSLHPLWAIAFFLMIFLLGLDSQFVGLEAVGTSLLDMMPKHRNKPWVREMLLAVIVAFSALLAIPMCAPGGIYLFKLFDYYGASGFNLLFLSSVQCLAVTYIYGAEKMWRNVTEMLGYKLNKFWLVSWKIITPVSCIVMILLKVVMFKSLVYPRPMGKNMVYNSSQEAVGWFLASLSMAPVPLVALYHAIFGNFKDSFKAKDEHIQYIVYNMKRNPESLQGSLTSILSECDLKEQDLGKAPVELTKMNDEKV